MRGCTGRTRIYNARAMRVTEFDYALPEELIAQHPTAQRRASRLLHMDGASGALHDRSFADLPQEIDFRDVLVLNDTRVIKARLAARKSTGGKLEIFVERMLGTHEAFVLLRSNHPAATDSTINIGDTVTATVLGRERDLYHLRF